MIAYTPIDIAFELPNKELLVSYVKDNQITNSDYSSIMCPVALRHNPNDWKDFNQVFSDSSYDLIDDYNLYFNKGVEELFPQVVKVLKELPFVQLFGALFSLHVKELHAHHDEVDPNLPPVPERFNVLLTDHLNQDSFFVSKKDESEKCYPKIVTPVYAFNNRDFLHGADIVLDDRVILIASGYIDKKAHAELVEKSVKKYGNYVIRF